MQLLRRNLIDPAGEKAVGVDHDLRIALLDRIVDQPRQLAVKRRLPAKKGDVGPAESADLLLAITPIGAVICTGDTGNDNSELVPVAVYENSDLQKVDILKENKGKSGIYR